MRLRVIFVKVREAWRRFDEVIEIWNRRVYGVGEEPKEKKPDA